MAAVHVSIGHDDHFVIAQLRRIKFLANTGTQSRDHRLQLVVTIDLVSTHTLHVQHFTPQRQNRLETGVAAIGGRAACRVTLYDINFGQFRIVLIAVTQLIRHSCTTQRCFAADGLSSLACCLTGTVGRQCLIQNGSGNHGMLFQINCQLIGNNVVHQRADMGVTQLCLGLSFKLCFRQLYTDDGGNTFATVLTADFVVTLDHTIFDTIGIEYTGQSCLKTGFMHTTLRGTNVIGKGYEVIVVAIVVLQRDFCRRVILAAGNIDDLLMELRLVLVQIGDVLPDTALIAHSVTLLTAGTLILDRDTQTCIQKGLLSHTGVEDLIVILHGVKHLVIRLKRHSRTGTVSLSHNLHFTDNIAA